MPTQTARDSAPEILIVDDTPEYTLMLSVVLGNGYRVRACQDGPSALRAVRERLPDLILLDVVMPEMNGHEVCRRLKADPETQAVPVIFASSLREWDDKLAAFMAGGIDYLPKPFSAKEVLDMVGAHLAPRAMPRETDETRPAQV